uniref:HAUS augmin-like complex subunit 6 N-terminal domain-containing protein n=1 Tax=Kalanchoe fedtschenkoi TaxID=63787 RepID=A0A7N0V8S1_KALFE
MAAMDREKEREIELESAMYTNCLLLGLDPVVIGIGAANGTQRVGLFRHSNPKLGEQLLYFILSSLRGPVQSAKDFDKVWPIFDSAQSRDFRKVVQGIISELESQGALPRSNSRVSSLATCCGPRFVELLWQLSLHALREVHRRTFAADVASNPLPASLTDVAFSHAATLLPVTKARIALERRRFLKNAEAAVQRQATWSSLAHEMTAEFRGLCAEEVEAELYLATRLWECLLSRKSQHEVLASGPIEDLIAHREHRYRISGSSLLAAMDQSSQIPYADVLFSQSGDSVTTQLDEQNEGAIVNREKQTRLESSYPTINNEPHSKVDDRSGRAQPTVDIAEVIRRWTHALQRIHKQSLIMTKANDGEGPELLRSSNSDGSIGHAESLAAILAEHQQHLASFQVLINQLKEVAPTIQKSISDCTVKVDLIASSLPQITRTNGWSTLEVEAHNIERENGSDEISDVASRLSNVHLKKASASPPTLKLPQLFSMPPGSTTKSVQKQTGLAFQVNQMENISDSKFVAQPLQSNPNDSLSQENDNFYVQNLKRSVREAALSMHSSRSGSSRDSQSDDSSEHFFVPLSASGFSRLGPENKIVSARSKRFFPSQVDNSFLDNHHVTYGQELRDVLNDLNSIQEYDQMSSYQSALTPISADLNARSSFRGQEVAQDQVFSPPLLMDMSLLTDAYEDLLAPLSETETALMEH